MNLVAHECIFCMIATGGAEVHAVYGDDLVLAFMDRQPINRGHLLVIPRKHTPRLADLPMEVGGHLFQIAQRLSQALRSSGLEGDGVSLLLADGEEADQDVPHLHLHVIPRFRGDGFRIEEGSAVKQTDGDLQVIARQIRGRLLLKGA